MDERSGQEEGRAPEPELRIGHAERAAALAALDEHFAKGRLDVAEYGDRSAAASAAVVVSELATLFRDLPAPHPDLPGHPAGSTGGAAGPGSDVVPRRRDTPARPWAEAAAVVLPVLAIALMLVLVIGFQSPIGFVMFPLIFMLAGRFGPRGHR